MNFNKVVILIRSVSGAGKSTFAKYIKNLYNLSNSSIADVFDENNDMKDIICCADDYMVDKDGNFDFKREKLGYAHAKCQEKFENALKNNVELVIVANTNCAERDFKFYIEKANEHGYTLFSVVLENRHGNCDVHGCPDETLKKQEQIIKSNIKLR